MVVDRALTVEDGRVVGGTGHFDVLIHVPELEKWLGANHGVSPKYPEMKVLGFTEGVLRAHLKRGEEKNYDMLLWCAVCRKAYEKK
jgi:hypothetical protein